MILEKHGLENAAKLNYVGQGHTQAVVVTDRATCVELELGDCNYAAGLTPEQAIFIAGKLVASARRVERAVAMARLIAQGK